MSVNTLQVIDNNTVVVTDGAKQVIYVNTPGPQGQTGPQGPAGGGSVDTSSFATTGSNTFTSNQWVKGHIVFGDNGQSSVDYRDSGSSIVMTGNTDAKITTNTGDVKLEAANQVYIYSDSGTSVVDGDLQVNGNQTISYNSKLYTNEINLTNTGESLYLDGDGSRTAYIKVDPFYDGGEEVKIENNFSNGNGIILTAHNNVNINSNYGDIVLYADGNVYKNSATAGNSLLTTGYLDSIIGDTSIVNNGTGHTITDNLANKAGLYVANTYIGNQIISGSITVQNGSYIPEPTFNIALFDNYALPSPGIYYITYIESNVYELIFPNPSDYDGCTITICNQLQANPGNEASISTTNRPYQKGSSTQIVSLPGESMWIFKSFNGKWRGGTLS